MPVFKFFSPLCGVFRAPNTLFLYYYIVERPTIACDNTFAYNVMQFVNSNTFNRQNYNAIFHLRAINGTVKQTIVCFFFTLLFCSFSTSFSFIITDRHKTTTRVTEEYYTRTHVTLIYI